jgi:hypothetical protein
MMILCGVNLNCVTDKGRKRDGIEISDGGDLKRFLVRELAT